MPIFSGQIGNFPERDPLAGKKESLVDLGGHVRSSRGETRREYPAYLERYERRNRWSREIAVIVF